MKRIAFRGNDKSKPKFKRRQRKKKQSSSNKALREVRQLKQLVNRTIENKHCDVSATNNSVSSAGVTYYSFLKVSQGTEDNADVDAGDYDARIGNSITLMKEKLHLYFRPPSTGTITENYNRIRVILVESLDGNQNLVLSDILKYHSYATHGDLVFVSPYTTKSVTNSRYKILMDKTWEQTYNGGKQTKCIKFSLNHGSTGRVVEFNDNAVDPVSYNLSLLMISDSASAAHPVWDMAYRATYKDA